MTFPQGSRGADVDMAPSAPQGLGANNVAKPSFDVGEATVFGQFVEAAYAMYEASPNNPTPPASSNFPAGYKLLAGITMKDFIIGSTDPLFYGFVAQSTSNAGQFVVAIRGTQSGIEWWDDFNAALLTPFKVEGCGSVGMGFARIYDTIALVAYPSAGAETSASERLPAPTGSLSQQVAALVMTHMPAEPRAGAAAAPPPTVSVAGHSLGSALATLYVLDNAKTNRLANPLICTFASPRVGDKTFVDAFDGLHLTSWRFDNDPDIVPQLPPQAFGFRHVDTLIPLCSAGKVQPSFSCWHALTTYLSLINPALKVDPACAVGASLAAAAAPRAKRSTSTAMSLNTGLQNALVSPRKPKKAPPSTKTKRTKT